MVSQYFYDNGPSRDICPHWVLSTPRMWGGPVYYSYIAAISKVVIKYILTFDSRVCSASLLCEVSLIRKDCVSSANKKFGNIEWRNVTATIWRIINSHLRPLGSGRVLRRRGFPVNYLLFSLLHSESGLMWGVGLGLVTIQTILLLPLRGLLLFWRKE